MQLFILILLLFLDGAGSASENDEAAITKFHEFDLALRTGQTGAEEQALQFFHKLDRTHQPRAWIYFHTLTQTYGEVKGNIDLDALLAEARLLSDQELLSFLIITRLVRDESQGSPHQLIMKNLNEGIEACRDSGNDYWCGRLYAETANYLFGVNDLALGLDYAKKSLARLESIQGLRRYYIYDTQAILANLLDRSGQSRQAQALMERNFEWFFEQNYLGDAAVMANNVALKILRDEDPDHQKIEYYLHKAGEIITRFPNKELATHVEYTRGTFLLRKGQALEARPLLTRSYETYMALGMKFLAYDALISKAIAEFDLNMEPELSQSLQLAEPLLKESYSRESLLLLELKYKVAKKKQNLPEALQIHEDLLSLWKKVQKDRDLKQKNRLSIELGLQVEEQRNELLQKQNELTALELKSAERFKYFAMIVSLFFLATAVLLGITFKQKERIHASKRKIKRILDSIDQGLLTIGTELQIETDYSPKTLTILDTQEDIAGRNFEAVAFAHSNLSLESKSMIHDILRSSLGEDRLAWDLNGHHLISEVEVGLNSKKMVNIRWIPILDQKNHVCRILVALTDITEERRLSKDLQEKNRQLEGLPDKLREILQLPQKTLVDFLNQTKDSLHQAETHLDLSSKRHIHTHKGLARTLGLRSISSALHDLESSFHAKTFGAALAQASREIAEYEAFVSIVGQNWAPQSHQGLIWLATLLSPHLKTWIQHASENGLNFQSLTIQDEILLWSQADLDLIEEVCVHAINNSLDHGFILPQRAGIAIPHPEIAIRAQRRNEKLVLEIIDNGAGLNMTKLKEIAFRKGLAVHDEQAITTVLFMDAVSTASTVSQSSGRGLGLAAIKSRIEAVNGCVHIRNRSDRQGTTLEAEWPAQAS